MSDPIDEAEESDVWSTEEHDVEVSVLTEAVPAEPEIPTVIEALAEEAAARPHGLRVDFMATMTDGRQHFSELAIIAHGGSNVLFLAHGTPRVMMMPIPDRLCTKLAKMYKRRKLKRSDK